MVVHENNPQVLPSNFVCALVWTLEKWVTGRVVWRLAGAPA